MALEHWTNYLITTPRPVFFSAHQTGEIKQTGENIAADIEKVITQIDHSKLSAIITDNASSMKKAWKLLAVKYPKVVFLGCIAHSLNLLVGDIMKLPWADSIMKNGKKIVKYFKSHQIPAAILKRHQNSNYDK
jgi:ABC-type Zn uptake system ZnuABC Zn-binding protein ZnuA